MTLVLLKRIVLFLAMCSHSMGYENEYGPEYGTKWLLFTDDNGNTHEMNFTALPPDTRGLMLGRVYFYLYTRQNVEDGELLSLPKGNSPIQSKYFNESNDIKAVTHGWLGSGSTEWLQNTKNELLRNEDTNVLTIDWHELAKNPLYPWPALCTRYVGKRMAKLIASLSKTYNINEKDIHLIGHSLGAQVMGFTGYFSKRKINRITGLDPARPLFEFPMMNKDFRLDKTDAEFVDIIHTCAGVLGYKYSHGHADFYPNGGKPDQPGCEGRQHRMEGCSHARSHQFFLESIDVSSQFTAYPCESWENFLNGTCQSNGTPMGYPAKRSRHGDFYLRTRNESKYALDDSDE